jgi:protein phosphatase
MTDLTNGEQLVHIPDPCLVLLVGVSGSGKSSFAGKHFGRYEVVSSDQCRAMICDNEDEQSVTPEAFELLRSIVSKRLAHGRLSVIDATNIRQEARLRNLEVARYYKVPVIALVFDVPPEVCVARNLRRTRRVVADSVVREQWDQLRQSLGSMGSEGYACIYNFDLSSIDNIRFIRTSADV